LGSSNAKLNTGVLQGIIDIKSQNNALLMKHLDKFYNQADIPWVTLTWSKFYSNTQTPPHARSPVGSFWWKDIMKLFDKVLHPVTPTEETQHSFDLTAGWEKLLKIPSHNHSLSLRSQSAPSNSFWIKRPAETSVFPFPHKLQNNLLNYKPYFQRECGMKTSVTVGLSLGDPLTSVAKRFISYSLDTLKHLPSSPGSRPRVIWVSISFSFGYC